MKIKKDQFIKLKMKNERIKITLILISIILLATILRIINLANWPLSFNQDEALNGYEAYSILKTGKDHRGNPWPIFFEGFSDKVDNRLPLYIYFTVPFVAIFGLNKFAVRLPAVIFGVLTVLMAYYLAKELFKKEGIGLLAAFFLAISPWHIFLSRINLETITTPFFLILTIYFFLKGREGKKFFIILTGISLALLFYTYHTAKLLVPLLGTALLFFSRKEIKKNKSYFFLACLLFLIISFPLLFIQISRWNQIQGRFNQISIFNYSYWPILFIHNLLTYFTPKFLLTHYPFFVILFFIIGIIFLIKLKYKKEMIIILVFLIISLIPAAILIGNPHSHHSMSIIPFIEIIAAFGCWKTLEIKRGDYIKNINVFLVLLFLFCFVINLNFLIKSRYPYNFINGFYQYIPSELITYLEKNKDKYKEIIFTNKANQPYIFFLFFTNYPPEKIENLNIKRTYLSNNLQVVTSFDKYKFCNLADCYSPKENNLYVAKNDELGNLKAKKIFYTVDGSILKIITND